MQAERTRGKWLFPQVRKCANERKKDPENREETPTSNRPASTGRRNMQDESRNFAGA
jgi:hypothetical protein